MVASIKPHRDEIGLSGGLLLIGGTRGEGDLAAGNFVAPTLFTDVTNDMSIAREEIFGPVLR